MLLGAAIDFYQLSKINLHTEREWYVIAVSKPRLPPAAMLKSRCRTQRQFPRESYQGVTVGGSIESHDLPFAGALAEIEERVGKPPRRFAALRLPGTAQKPPAWLKPPDPTCNIFKHRSQIVRDGEVRWAHIVQANNHIFAPGNIDRGAQVIYAPNADISLYNLSIIAGAAFALKNTQPSDPLELKLANMLTDEYERALDWIVPKSLTAGIDVITTIVIVPRSQTPGGLLAVPYFPIFADPQTRMALMIPSRYWPNAMCKAWETEAEQQQQSLAHYQALLDQELAERDFDLTNPVVELTESAAAKIKKIITDEKLRNARLHVGVQPADNLSHVMKFSTDPVNPARQITYEFRGISIVIEREQVKYLYGTTISFRNQPDARGFVFDNPNAS